MFKAFTGHFSRGVKLAQNNPQVIFTIFIMILIPLAFFASGQRFLDASNENQERIERESIGLLQDAVVAIAPLKMDDPEFLNQLLQVLKKDNDAIQELAVVGIENNEYRILASLDETKIGTIDQENEVFYQTFESLTKQSSAIFPSFYGDERHWRAYRAVIGESGETIGFLFTDISMRRIDSLAAQSISRAYIFLGFIVFAILLLLIRQAKIIDYTVLYRRLKEVDQMKDDFISMAAHELRTPLTIIRGYADMLGGIKDLSPEDKERLRRIDVSAKGLNTLIGDILDVSRLEQGRMKFELAEIDPNAAVAALTESFQTVAQGKGLALSYLAGENIPKIAADSERLRQVLTNIIGNAVKYTPAGSVAVKVSFDELKKKVYIRVSDTGLGISAEDQKRLFEKFFRVKSAETGTIQGTGLGLWITHEIVRAMQGEITVESIKGKGTDFIVSFPAVAGVK
ncbi:MAG: HAMP domain-containing histidine kinase [Parcubacteria group bacterium]|nr:HAMP domain-containing histidine kinase [Parcubacteria group bacterium]